MGLAQAQSVDEGNTFTIAVTAPDPCPSDNGCTLSFTTADGTATAGQDYTASSGTLNFAFQASTASNQVQVPTLDDTLVEGSETFQVRFTGSTGFSSAALPNAVSVTINDNDTNQAPVCSIDSPTGNPTINPGDSINLQSTVSDPNQDSLSIDWNIAGGNPSSSTLEDPGAVSFASPGTFTISLTVSDGQLSCTDTTTVVVQSAPAPQFSITINQPTSAQTINVGDSLDFSSTVSGASSASNLSFDWTFPNGSPASSALEDPGTVTFNTAGSSNVTVTVTDNASGQTASDSVTITIQEETPPPASLTITIDQPAGGQTINVGDTISFASTVAGAGDTSNLTFSWNFGANATPSTSSQEDPGAVTFNAAETVNVTVTVSDSLSGQTATAAVPITVQQQTTTPPPTTTPDELLVGLAQTEPQRAVGRAIGITCPTDAVQMPQTTRAAAFRRDCNAVVGGGFNNDPNVSGALAQITADDASMAADISLNSIGLMASKVSTRLAALRSGIAGSGVSLAGLNINWHDTRISGTQMMGLVEALKGGGAGDEDSGFSRLGGFISGEISAGDKDDTSNEEGFDFDVYALTAGADYRLNDNVILGAALGYSAVDTDVDNDGGELDADGYSLTLFGTYYNELLYVDGSVTLGRSDYDQERTVNYRLSSQQVDQTFSADYEGDLFAVTLSAGYQYSTGPLTLTPSGTLQYIKADIDSFREDSGNLDANGSAWAVAIDDQTFKSLTLSFGGQVSYAVSQSWGVLLPYASFEWVHEFEDSDDEVEGRFVADPNQTQFVLPTDSLDENYYNLGLGVSAQFTNGVGAFFNYQQLLGYDDLDSYSLSAGVRLEF